jgi:hypothetical protein
MGRLRRYEILFFWAHHPITDCMSGVFYMLLAGNMGVGAVDNSVNKPECKVNTATVGARIHHLIFSSPTQRYKLL